MNPADLFRFLEGRRLAVLSTISPEKKPQSALMHVAITNTLEIVFDTARTSRKYRNLKANPSVSLVMGWAGEITVQYEGNARELSGSDLARYQHYYFEQWPDGRFRAGMPDISYFVVRPRWARYSDYSKTPPDIYEVEF